MRRRDFVAGSLLLSRTASAAGPPNVLVFMSDQESALLPGPVNLPNREKLFGRGTSFVNAFCNTPQCSASRACLLTGNEPNVTGVLTNVDGESLGKPLAAKLPNVASVFQAAGYQTGYFGKWHLGAGGPAACGFSHQRADNGDEAATDAAAQWVRSQPGPWLAWVSVLDPHRIYDIRKALEKTKVRAGVTPPVSGLVNLKAKPAEQIQYVEQDQGRQTRDFSPDDWLRYRSYYLDLVERVDVLLGRVLAAVPDIENTIAIYTSDHGDALGEHGLPYKGPFMYEEEIRVPLMVRAPRWSGGAKRTGLVTLADVAPTLASLAGVKWPGSISGFDLTRTVDRDAVFLEYYAKQKWVNPIRTIRTREWKLNAYDRGNRELYDLRNDPHELVNRAGAAATSQIEHGLMSRLDAWRGPILKESSMERR